MAGVKKPLSYLDLDRANPTATLFEKLFRDAVDYKKEIDDVFEAIVLTDPTLATKDAESALKNQLITIPAENPNKRTTYIFIARIIGRDSPHLFLPDPLEFNVTDDEDCKKRYHNLLQLHTKVTANGLSVSEMPAKGDTIQIRLVKGDYVYKTAFCNDFLGVTVKASSTPEVVEKLKKNEEGAKGAFKSSTPTTAAASTDKKIALQAAYLELKNDAGSEKITEKQIYDYLSNALGGSPQYHNLILGIMANIKAESGYDANIVSGASGATKGESSIGLFQMNVGSNGYYKAPRSGMAGQLTGAGAPEELAVKSDNKNVPYFAGGLFLQSKKIDVITPDKFDGNKESVRSSYEALIEWKDQLSFAVGVVNDILPIPPQNINDHDANVWSSWFQVYFEQPAKIKSRTPPSISLPTS